ncbi:hypothetical protein R2F61_02455 [Mollicutes bacterium LVI A0078]|nr:hypothetical protein RZE84_02485 [Mollicutes bacterium LVI A0075]WOO91431.1 hypothetical protein R2F61_02455 [Mollicutes bacterium LVI A0078]
MIFKTGDILSSAGITEKVLYTEFYKTMIDGISRGVAAPVKREEALCVIHLLETIVNNNKYNKQQFLNLIK